MLWKKLLTISIRQIIMDPESVIFNIFEKFGWIDRDGHKPISDRRSSKSPIKFEPNEVKQIFHRIKEK